MGKPTLVRRVATQITSVGVKLGLDATRLFKTTRRLAMADETEWLKIQESESRLQQQIVREI